MKKQIRWKYLINSTVMLVGVMAVIIVFNILVSVFVDKFPVKLDLTEAKVFEISESTYEYLESFDTPVTIYILAGEQDQDDSIRTVLDKYEKANKNIKIVNINPSENPTFGRKYVEAGNRLSMNSVIVDAGNRFKVYSHADMYNVNSSNIPTSIRAEQKITAALKYVSSSIDYKVYFVRGHGEESLDGAEMRLKSDNYVTGSFNIASEEIPSDADMLIVVNPRNDFTKAEIAKLDAFFKNAGKAQFLFEGSSPELPNLYELIREWGIQVNNDLVIDESNVTNIGLVKAENATNDITAPIVDGGRITAYYPFPKSVTKLYDSNSGVEVIPIIVTSESAYAKGDITEAVSAESIVKNENDKTGEFIIAAAATKQGANPDEDAIIFVSGSTLLLDTDPDMLAEYGFANYDIYSAVMNYLEGSKENYSIQPRSLVSNMLTIEILDFVVMGGITVIIIPIAALIFGITVWIRRKHL
ncbi:MAG: GldG family protein [Oscillospiraceae bacterium]|nr:GldG family protein [Oscillospiraceae bacterium]